MTADLTIVIRDGEVIWAGAGHWPQGDALEEAEETDGATEHWVTLRGAIDSFHVTATVEESDDR